MAHLEEAYWPGALGAPGKRNQVAGPYSYYVPDRLSDLALRIPSDLAQKLSSVEQRLRDLIEAEGAGDLADISRFLLRSEAIASSQIEGIEPAPRQVALAELGQHVEVSGVSDNAQMVARNIVAVQQASSELARKDVIEVSDLVALHESLVGEEFESPGIRTTQNWIGHSYYHPLDADFVPPAPELVKPLLEDLASYMSGSKDGALIQAALVHAQFETIHPFADGNGRVGRALIHTVLSRRGVTPGRLLPVSQILATFSDKYVHALTGYRYVGDAEASENQEARNSWIEFFAWAVDNAIDQSELLLDDLRRMRSEWDAALNKFREAEGHTKKIPQGSAILQILDRLSGTPILTSVTASEIHGISSQAARDALNTLADAGILQTQSIGRRGHAYVARDVLDLINMSERRLASTRFNTLISPPTRSVPVRSEKK